MVALNRRRIDRKSPEGRRKALRWTDGGEGFIKWCHDLRVAIEVYEDGFPVFRPLVDLSTEIHPQTGRCSKDMWEAQQEIARECLAMKNNEFLYRLIIFCWMRGEGKSLLVCLIQLWKFFCFPSQKIMLGANSKDQSKFVHYDIMRAVLLNTPRLLRIIGEKNIQEKQISLKDRLGRVVSFIRSISSFSGIVSNITGYTFSEMFDMKSPKFFTQIDGSIRNVPNALGIIDSTVSDKNHVLYKMYKSWTRDEDPTLYFSHRESQKADWRDYWNPNMTRKQLKSYQVKFPANEYAQYFKNTWEAGSNKLFTEPMVKAIRYIGVGNSLGEQNKILKKLENVHQIENNKELHDNERAGLIETQMMGLIDIHSIYKLESSFGQPQICSVDDLKHLGDVYDTDWAILTGADRADPMKADITKGAKTMITAIAKGLPGSRSNPKDTVTDSESTRYIYFLLHLVHVVHSDITTIKRTLEEIHEEYDGVDTFCTERWGMWDMGDWCEDRDIAFDPVTATYNRQKESFTELYILFKDGRFKAPQVVVRGAKQDDVLVEEAQVFDHNKAKKFYGSTEKGEKFGIQDDVMFALGWTIYGGRMLNVDDFKPRELNTSFGEFYKGQALVGRY